MANENDIELRFKTLADLSGADATQEAFEGVTQSAETLQKVEISRLLYSLDELKGKLDDAQAAEEELAESLEKAQAGGVKEEVEQAAAALKLAKEAAESLAHQIQSTETILEAGVQSLEDSVAAREKALETEKNLAALEAESEARKKAAAEEVLALEEELAQKKADRAEGTDGTKDSSDADAARLEQLAGGIDTFNAALEAGDHDAAVEIFLEMRKALDELAESAEELPPNFGAFNKKLDELEKQVKDKKTFLKLSKQAQQANKSLKTIEKIKVAEALADIVVKARSAGKGLAALGKDGESAIDIALDAASAVGDLASGIAAGFATGGIVGAGIAAVTAGLSLFSESVKASQVDIDGLAGAMDGLATSYSNIENATVVDDHFNDFTEALASQTEHIQANSAEFVKNIHLKQGVRAAELSVLRADVAFQKEKIESSDLSKPEKIKAKAQQDTRLRDAVNTEKKKQLEDELKIINDQKLTAQDVFQKEKAAFLAAKNGVTQADIDEQKKVAKDSRAGAEESLKTLLKNLPSSFEGYLNRERPLVLEANEIKESFLKASKLSDGDEKDKLVKQALIDMKALYEKFEKTQPKADPKHRSSRFAQLVRKSGPLAIATSARFESSERAKKSAEELEKQIPKQKKIIEAFPDIKKKAALDANEFKRREELTKANQAALSESSVKNKATAQSRTNRSVAAAEEQIAKKLQQEKDKAAQAEIKAAKKAADKAAALASNQGKRISSKSGSTKRKNKKGQQLIDKLAEITADGKVDGAEQSEYNKILELIKKSAGKNGDDTMKMLSRMLALFEQLAANSQKQAQKLSRLEQKYKLSRPRKK